MSDSGAVYISMADSYTLYTAHRCGTCNDVRRRGRRARRRIRIERVDRVLIIANSSCTPFTSTSSSRLKLEHHRTQQATALDRTRGSWRASLIYIFHTLSSRLTIAPCSNVRVCVLHRVLLPRQLLKTIDRMCIVSGCSPSQAGGFHIPSLPFS